MSDFVSLMYHNVCPQRSADGSWPGFTDLSPSITGYFVDGDTFGRHCSIIRSSGLCVGADGLPWPYVETSDGDQRPGVQITFDDGWRGTYDEAGPLLESHGLRAVLFVTTDLIGHPDFVARHQLAASSPTFAIGAHGRTHRPLATLPDDAIREELTTSKATLEDILGSEVDRLALPGGSFDDRVVRIARDVGYRTLFTSQVRTNSCSSECILIGRVPIKTGTDDAAIERYVTGDLRRERLRTLMLEAAKRLLGRRGYAAARSRLLSEDRDQLEMTDLSRQVHATRRHP